MRDPLRIMVAKLRARAMGKGKGEKLRLQMVGERERRKVGKARKSREINLL